MNWFPSDGWGDNWLGEPDRGYGLGQPGSWAYSVLPYIEQGALHDLGTGTTGTTLNTTRLQLIMTPVVLFTCPSRRQMGVWPLPSSLQNWFINCITISQNTRMDYAINTGDADTDDVGGPLNYTDGNNPRWSGWQPPGTFTGVSFQRSQITPAHITDGLSNTYLLGEEEHDPDLYFNGQSPDDDFGPFAAVQNDSSRLTNTPPLQDASGVDNYYAFGSVHSGTFNMSFCDGSVRAISYSIDPELHRRLGNRADGLPIDESKY